MVKVISPYLALAHVSHFFPNDLRCGFRKLKERGVGNRTSGAVLVPKSLLLLLALLAVRPHVRRRNNIRHPLTL